MRRRCLGAALFLVLLGVPAAPSSGYGRPSKIRAATLADLRAHPAEPFESWTLILIGPHPKDLVRIMMFRTPDPPDFGSFFAEARGVTSNMVVTPGPLAYGRGPIVSARGDNGRSSMRRARDGVRISMTDYAGSANVVVSATRPGPWAGRWHVGLDNYDHPQYFTISFPIATGVAHGTIQIVEDTINVSGWRATLEHRWGNFNPESIRRDWIYWDTIVVHGPRMSADLVTGIDLARNQSGLAELDATWSGVLAHVGPGAPTLCRPRIKRAWYFVDRHPLTWTASCRGRAVRFRAPLPGGHPSRASMVGTRRAGWGYHWYSG